MRWLQLCTIFASAIMQEATGACGVTSINFVCSSDSDCRAFLDIALCRAGNSSCCDPSVDSSCISTSSTAPTTTTTTLPLTNTTLSPTTTTSTTQSSTTTSPSTTQSDNCGCSYRVSRTTLCPPGYSCQDKIAPVTNCSSTCSPGDTFITHDEGGDVLPKTLVIYGDNLEYAIDRGYTTTENFSCEL